MKLVHATLLFLKLVSKIKFSKGGVFVWKIEYLHEAKQKISLVTSITKSSENL